jgi:hypothetical protein
LRAIAGGWSSLGYNYAYYWWEMNDSGLKSMFG